MARDPNKYRENEDLNEADDEEEEDDFEGRPEQSDKDDDAVGLEEEPVESVRAGRRRN